MSRIWFVWLNVNYMKGWDHFMKIIKRSGIEAVFDVSKIVEAVKKANDSVIDYEKLSTTQIQEIAQNVEIACKNMKRTPSVQEIQDMGFQASSNKELLESAQQTFRIIELVLGGIGMIAFLVAAIGIANTMMMSTYERTKEIGIMKVLGCDMRDILKLFLSEAGFIGFIGGVAGLLFTMLLSAAANAVAAGYLSATMGMADGKISIITWWLALIAVVFATLMGMIAGFFPARRAMKLSPLAAIRNE